MIRLPAIGLAILLLGAFTIAMPSGNGTAHAASAVDSVFGKLFGSWRGRGSFRQAPDKPRESVVCKVRYNKQGDTRVGLDVRCSGADFAIKANGTVIYNPNSKRFRGNLRDPGMGWTMKLSGGLFSNGRLRFSLVIPEADTKGWMSIRMSGSRRHTISVLSSDQSKGKLTESMKISFRK